jgi:hypothetical protein
MKVTNEGLKSAIQDALHRLPYHMANPDERQAYDTFRSAKDALDERY